VNILIAVHHEIVRDGITKILSEDVEINVIGTAKNKEELCTYEPEGVNIDIVVLDIDIPNLDPLNTITKILRDHLDTHILAMSDEEDPRRVKDVMQAGASGYILKKRGAEELIKAIKEVYSGNQYLCNDTIESLIEGEEVRSTSERITDLTERELQVLQLICREQINREIAEELGISVRTVDAHRRNLMQKTGVKNTAGLVKFAIKNNLFDLK
jgi:DNA-binding NarL/FixJ family response regulator